MKQSLKAGPPNGTIPQSGAPKWNNASKRVPQMEQFLRAGPPNGTIPQSGSPKWNNPSKRVPKMEQSLKAGSPNRTIPQSGSPKWNNPSKRVPQMEQSLKLTGFCGERRDVFQPNSFPDTEQVLKVTGLSRTQMLFAYRTAGCSLTALSTVLDTRGMILMSERSIVRSVKREPNFHPGLDGAFLTGYLGMGEENRMLIPSAI
jgi:hypothetical protein